MAQARRLARLRGDSEHGTGGLLGRANPQATAEAMRGDWYITGDRATVDEDGHFWFVGRADDVMIPSGYRIGPFEVESAMLEHPAVADAAAVASPDPLRGEIVKGFVVLKPGYEGSDELVREIQEHVRTVTAPYKYPREIEFVTELPKTVSGKIAGSSCANVSASASPFSLICAPRAGSLQL